MPTKSYWRGYPIVWIKSFKISDETGRWFFEDTMEPLPDHGGAIRPCAECNKIFKGSYNGEADPCLGELPGVDNACCGHGIKSESYIRFTNGIIIKNFDI